MSQSLPSPRKTLVAVAVVAMTTGCATTDGPRGPGHDGGLTDGLARAGQKTVGFGQTVWHRTGYLLGLHDDPGVPLPQAPAAVAQAPAPSPALPVARPAAAPSGVPVAKLPLHLDEVDLALMEEDALMPGADAASPPLPTATSASPFGDDALLASADAPGALDVLPFEDAAPVPMDAIAADPLDPLGLDGAPVAVAPAAGTSMPVLAADVPAELTADTVAVPAPAPEPAPAVVAANDLEHRVGETETLWDIAKTTTGDATNWHTLADVNDLGPGASVYPGQVLTIPADMLRPELAGGQAVASAPAAESAPVAPAPAPAIGTDVAAAPATRTERLTIPGGASPVATPVTAPSDGATKFSLGAGETLWDFAKRTTGDATNWQTIATQNGFDERQAVAVYAGQSIFVPSDMVVERDANGTLIATADGAVATPVPQADARPVAPDARDTFVPIPSVGDTLVSEARSDEETVDASAAVLAGTNGLEAPTDAADEDIRIVEAAFTGGPEADLPATDGTSGGVSSLVISGTYYPKAIYSDADFSAGLLMRVSPGTRLDVSSVDGKWYRVETERGTGWVHQRDIK